MPEGSGLLRVRNRAFRLLADVLDLPGGENVERIDVDHATPVVDLTTIIERDQTVRFLFNFLQTTTGGGTLDQEEESFYDSTNWNNVWSSPGGYDEVPAGWDYWIVGIQGQGSSSMDNFGVMFQRGAGATARLIYRADRWARAFMLSQGMQSGQGPWQVPPPIYHDITIWDETITWWMVDGGGGSPGHVVAFELIAAPVGILPPLP